MQVTKKTVFSEGERNLLELMQVLVRRRRMIAVSSLAAALLSTAVTVALPDRYSATATVLPPQKESAGGLSALLGQNSPLSGLTAGIFGGGSSTDLYLGILKSRSVADAVVARLDLTKAFDCRTADEARKLLEDRVKVKAGKDGIITINVEAPSPRLAADIANTMVSELGRKSVALNLTKAGGERSFLEKRLDLSKAELKKAEEDLKAFQLKNRSIKVDSQASATIDGLARIKGELATREVQLASLAASRTPENHEVKALQGSIARLKGEIGSIEGVGGRDAIPAVGNVPSLSVEYARRMRELKVQEAIFEQLTKQHEIAKLTEAKDSASLQVLDDAVPPLEKSNLPGALTVLGCTAIAFLLSSLGALLAEYVATLPEEDRRRLGEIKKTLCSWRARCYS